MDINGGWTWNCLKPSSSFGHWPQTASGWNYLKQCHCPHLPRSVGMLPEARVQTLPTVKWTRDAITTSHPVHDASSCPIHMLGKTTNRCFNQRTVSPFSIHGHNINDRRLNCCFQLCHVHPRLVKYHRMAARKLNRWGNPVSEKPWIWNFRLTFRHFAAGSLSCISWEQYSNFATMLICWYMMHSRIPLPSGIRLNFWGPIPQMITPQPTKGWWKVPVIFANQGPVHAV